MKKTFKIIILSLAFSVFIFSRGMLAGSITKLVIDTRTNRYGPTFSVKKEGALIYTAGYKSYCTNTDFTIQMAYQKDYVPDATIRYSYTYDKNTGNGFLKDDSDNIVHDSILNPVLDAIKEKKERYDGCTILKDGSLYFIDTLPDKKSFRHLSYYNGSEIKYIFSHWTEAAVEKIKVLDNFVK